MVDKRSWQEFRDSGLLWFINTILHVFGWAIVIEIDEDNVIDVYPARVSFRGFDEKRNDKGYYQVSKYLKDNITYILSECDIPDDEDKKENP